MGIVGSLIARLVLDKSNYSTGLKTAGSDAKKFGMDSSKVFNAFKIGAVAAFAAVTAATIKAVKDAMNYERILANVSTMVTSDVGPAMDQFNDALLEQSKLLGEDVETLGKGLYDILSAGITDTSDALNVLEQSSKAARAGLTDTGVAADALTTLINAYKLSADDASKVSDILFTVVQRGKTTFGELAPAIGRVATISSQAGVSMEEMGAALAILTRNGIKTDEAVTALRGVITRFLKPTDELTAAFGENALQSRGLADVLNQMAGMPPDVIAKLIPDVRGMLGAVTAAGDMAEETQIFLDTLAKGSPTLDAFNKQTGTMEFAMDRFNKTVKAVGIEAGQEVIPGLKELVEGLTQVIDDNKQIVIDFASAIGGAFKNLGIIIKYFSMLGEQAENTGGKVDNFRESIAISSPLMAVFFGLFDVGKAAIDGVIGAMEEEIETHEENKKAVEDEAKARKKAEEEKKKQAEQEKKQLEEQRKREEEERKRKLEAEKKLAEERADIREEFRRGMLSDKEREIEDIKELEERYKQAGVDRVKLHEWMLEELARIEEKYKEKVTDTEEEIIKTVEDTAGITVDYEKTKFGELEILDEEHKTNAIQRAHDVKMAQREAAEETKNIWEETYEKIKNVVNTVTNSIMGAIGAYYDYQRSELENWYATEKKTRLAGIEDEEKKKEIEEDLEKEFAIKKAEMAREEFFWNKAETIIQIGVDTARATIAALPNLVLSGIIAGMGVVQASFVAAQKPPPLPSFQRGGWINGVPGTDKNMVMASTGEFIVNKKAAAENSGVLEGINSGKQMMPSIILNPIPVNIVLADGRIIGNADLEFIHEQSKLGNVIIHPRAVKDIG